MSNTTDLPVAGNKVWGKCYFNKEEILMVTEIPSNAYYINSIVGVIFNVFLTISTIFLNSVTILAYVKSTFLKSKKSYFLIMLLSVSDLLVGLFANGSFVLLLIIIIIGYPKCELYILFHLAIYCPPAMSITTLFGLNIERYLSILHPFYHRTKVTKPKLLKMIVTFWILTITLGVASTAYGNVLNIIVGGVFAVIAGSTLYIYIAVYMAVRRRPRVTETVEQTTEERVERRTNEKKDLQKIKMAKSCAIVVGLVFVCQVPTIATNLVARSNFPTISVLWGAIILMSASSLNSLVFFWNNPILIKESKKLFKI